MLCSDLLTEALVTAGILGAGRTAAPQELSEAFTAVNNTIDSWNTERPNLFYTRRDTLALTAATASYTVFTGGTFNIPRPLRILKAGVLLSSGAFEVPVDVLTFDEWNQVLFKTNTATMVERIYFDANFPQPSLFVNPIPSATGQTLVGYSSQQLAQFATQGDTVSLPPGYVKALVYTLAVELQPRFRKPVDPALVALANAAKTSLMALNAANAGIAVAPTPAPQQAQQS